MTLIVRSAGTSGAQNNVLTANEIFASVNNRIINVPANIFENDEEYRLELLCPGFDKESFNIEVDEDGVLTVSAEAEEGISDEDEEVLRQDFRNYDFSRSFRLPSDAVHDEIDAWYEGGILSLVISKTEEEPEILEITIN